MPEPEKPKEPKAPTFYFVAASVGGHAAGRVITDADIDLDPKELDKLTSGATPALVKITKNADAQKLMASLREKETKAAEEARVKEEAILAEMVKAQARAMERGEPIPTEPARPEPEAERPAARRREGGGDG